MQYNKVIYREFEETLLKLGHLKNIQTRYNRRVMNNKKFTPIKFYNLVDFLKNRGHEIEYELCKEFHKSYIILVKKSEDI